ncbi:MAG: hypothetical protein LBE96_22290, partial [Kalamiella piersonii]|nr:hypothetical protein [Pantoea piersonii]MBZ6429207.1 hypothetical protein [Pantoea piersonii]
SRPRPWQGRALPTELFPRLVPLHKFFIGTGCALYEKLLLLQESKSKILRFRFVCRLKQQPAVFLRTFQR